MEGLVRKLAPRGTVSLWCKRTSDQLEQRGPSPPSASGVVAPECRNVGAEESRCGMLCRLALLRVAAHQQHGHAATKQTATTPTAVVAAAAPRLRCIVKGQSSDWQLNEVGADGTVATLQRAPKARWRKVDRNQNLLIEDDGKVPFDDPGKTYSPRTTNLGKYVRQLGRVTDQAPVLQFSMYRDSYTVDAVRNRMRYEAGIAPHASFFASEPSGFGCVTQEGTALGVSTELLPHASRHYNIHPLLFDPIRMHSMEALASLRRPHRGYFFRVLLRCVEGTEQDVAEHLAELQNNGFVNYFDLGRFMATANHAQEIAAYAAAGNYFQAVSLWTQCMAERNPLHHKHFLRYLNANGPGVAQDFLRLWAQSARDTRLDPATVQYLKKLAEVTDFSDRSTELEAVWGLQPHRAAMFQSGAEFVWNAMVSQRLLTHGLRVVVGDVVRTMARSSSANPHREPPFAGEHLGRMNPSVQWEHHRVATAEEARAFTIQDVVLPVPYVLPRSGTDTERATTQDRLLFPTASGCTRRDYEAFASLHKLNYLFEVPDVSSASLSPTGVVHKACQDDAWLHGRRTHDVYRHVVQVPEGIQFRVLRDPNSFAALKTDHFLMQERMPSSIVSVIDPNRVREPSVFNVSERFAERMEGICAAVGRGAQNSVVVTGFVPRGSHPSVLLREAFDVTHATSYDLLEPSWL